MTSTTTSGSVTIRHAWLQKHASPAARGGEFHWYPLDGDRDLRAACVERMRGVDPPAVLWELAPGRVVWTQLFAATAPSDGRRYIGLVLSVIERRDARPAELLEAASVPRAAPWEREVAVVEPRHASVPLRSFGTLDIELDAAPPFVAPSGHEVDVAAVARALLGGGTARVGDPTAAELPACIASVERWLPASVTRAVRRGAWLAGQVPAKPDRVGELIANAWRDPRSSAARAWRVLVELAETRNQTIDEVAGALELLAAAPVALEPEETARLTGPRTLVDVLHAWGRGRFDQCPTAGSLVARLADAVALRVLAWLVDNGDPRAVIAEVRWHALLPEARRARLLDEIASRAGSLRALVATAPLGPLATTEVGHA